MTKARPVVQKDDLQAVLSRARVGILHRDLNRRVLVVNDAYCTLVGRSAEELDGLSFEDFTHPGDVERSRQTYRGALDRAEPFEIEKRYMRPDGASTWCAVHVSFVLDAGGVPQSTITIASDISGRRKAEQNLRESEEHYRCLVELNPQISWTAGPDGSILEVSPRWHDITGVAQQAALGDQWKAVLHPGDVPATAARWAESLATTDPVDVEYRLRTADAGYRWFRARAAARLDETGQVVRWYGTLEDIHDRRVAQDDLRDSEERFRLAAQAAGLGIWDYDATLDRRQWSDEFKDMLGLPRDVTPAVQTALDLVIPEDRHMLSALVHAAQAGDISARFEVTLRIARASDGAHRWIRTSGWRMHSTSGRLTRVLVTIRDVTEERTAEQRIRWTATHDALTRILNRAAFTEQLDAAIARAVDRTELALILFDVDHLKEVNDTVGHDAGDALLKGFARRLIDAFGPDAVVGRLGGDEFAVLIENVSRDQAAVRVDAALKLLRTPFDHEGNAFSTQATAGASVFPADGDNAADLLKSADVALYHGKANRRGALSQFRPLMRAGVQLRASMLNVARTITRDDGVIPFYQPKVALTDGRLVGFEALLRWRHDSKGIQGPDMIAAAFDDLSLAVALSDRMIAGIARDMRDWLDRGLDPGRMAINLAPAEFRHDEIVDRILAPFSSKGIPFDLLELEITETVLLGRDAEKIAATLASFHQHGLRIALDDFGTGYASLTHLKAFPVDVIKIDKSFVENVCTRSADSAIVDAVLGLAHRLGLEIVAEGIERREQAAYLAERGCTYGQGYLFGKAVSAASVQTMLAGDAPRRLTM